MRRDIKCDVEVTLKWVGKKTTEIDCFVLVVNIEIKLAR